MIDSEADMEKTEIKNGSEIYDTVRELLRLFGADSVQTVEFTDSRRFGYPPQLPD